MLNVYTFHATLTSKSDLRDRKEVKLNQEGLSLSQAWDLAEKRVVREHPDAVASLSVGNRQPLHLRPGFRQ